MERQAQADDGGVRGSRGDGHEGGGQVRFSTGEARGLEAVCMGAPRPCVHSVP